MLRSDLIHALQRVTTLIVESKVATLLRPSSTKSESSVHVLNVYRYITSWESSAGPTERKILEIMGLLDLFDDKLWNLLVRGEDARHSPSVLKLYQSIYYTEAYLSNVVALISRGAEDEEQIVRRADDQVATSETVRVLMLEEEGESSRPDRVIEVMASMSLIYSAVALLHNEAINNLSVVACDSGSTKVFDFRGSGEVIREAKQAIIDLWNTFAFHQERKTAAGQENAMRSLTLLKTLADLRDRNAIDPETAGRITRDLTEGLTKFINAGLMIPELKAVALPSPEKVLKPEGRFLLAPPSSTEAQASTHKEAPPKKPRRSRERRSSGEAANASGSTPGKTTSHDFLSRLSPDDIKELRKAILNDGNKSDEQSERETQEDE